jgi:type I restriction enzyme S subunit
VALGDLMVSRGGSVDPAKFPDEKFDLYSIPAFDRGTSDIVQGADIGSTKQVVRPGDVLLSKIVPHIRRSWVVGPSRGHRVIASGEWIVFRSSAAHPPYLRHVLTGDPFHAQFMATVSGVGGSLLRARPAFVARIDVPLPPIEEQRRIAEVLDRAAALRAKRREALAHLDDLTQSIFLDMFGDPVRNPLRLPTSTVGDSAVQVTDGEHQTPRREADGIRLLSARNVRDGFLDLTNVDYIGDAEFDRIRRRCEPTRGDILISCSGTIGRVSQVRSETPFALVRSVALVRPDVQRVTSTFLEHQLRQPTIKALMLQRANASSQANLFQNQIRSLPLVLPPVSYQSQFGSRAATIDTVRDVQRAQLAQLDVLFGSLQQRAFSGQL